MPKIGAHVSTAGSLDLSFERAEKIGAECTQIFLSPPQTWFTRTFTDEAIATFLKRQEETGIMPTVVHGIYLINLATDNPANLKRAISWLKWSQQMCGKLNLMGTIFHLGSHKGRGFEVVKEQVCDALKEVLAETPDGVVLMLENSAGAGGSVGGKFEELGELLKAVQSPKLKVCIDTQHAFVSGYDIRDQKGVNQFVDEIDRLIGLDNVTCFHCNDSKTEFDSGKDRHENIGMGKIGEEGFKCLLNHPQLADKPFVLEVPGLEDDGPDKPNLDLMKSFIGQ